LEDSVSGPYAPNILVIGTGDTKGQELEFMAGIIRDAGATPVLIDVGVLGDPPFVPEYSRHDVAHAAGMTIEAIIASGDENSAMALMALGASKLARRLCDASQADAVIMLGGTMGTDLALDVAAALPLGMPKFVVSTVAYSHLIPPERIAPDLMMILWAGGLYGLNDICRSVLSQACGAVVGAARSGTRPTGDRPLIGVTSLGLSCLSYLKHLKPELEKRGYDVAVFHATGMGGRAFEAIAARKGFAAVFDFCIQEVTNHHHGTVVTSGPDRLENAGRQGIPQIVAPGAADMVDLPAWQALPQHLADRPYHAHNRLLGSVTTTPALRRDIARVIGDKLRNAAGPVAFLLPTLGIQEWDQQGKPLYEPQALEAFVNAMRASLPANVVAHEIAAHINDAAFSTLALEIFDDWVRRGIVVEGRP
jgi:uncharacterized protein (UPF0261 family)